MKDLKNDLKKVIQAKDKEIAETREDLLRLQHIVEKETDSRIFFNKELEKKSSHLESKITNIISSTKTSELEEEMSSQRDLEVITNDNKTNEYSYHGSASSSVQKPKKEEGLGSEKSHSTINSQGNIPYSVSEVQVSNSNVSTKVSKSN